MTELCPSILAANFNRLGEQIHILEEEGIHWLHIDVMDGMFVPDISFGMPVIRSIRKESGLFFDTHLMIEEPLRYVEDFKECGSDSLTIHLEACKDPMKTLRAIHEAGMRTGLSIKPATPVEAVLPYLSETDMVLVMTVEPGFGGQKYIPASTERIRRLRRLLSEEGCSIGIQVDGGICDATIAEAMGAGADHIVAGSWVFGQDVRENVRHALAAVRENDGK